MSLVMKNIKFIPPKDELKKLPRYASYSVGQMKTHGGIGFAKNSLNNRMWGRKNVPEDMTWDVSTPYAFKQLVTFPSALLELVDGEYYTLYSIDAGMRWQDLPWVDEYFYSYNSWTKLTDYYRESDYYGPKLKNGSVKTSYRVSSMTTDEYVNWRLAVERERVSAAMARANFQDKQIERLVSQDQ